MKFLTVWAVSGTLASMLGTGTLLATEIKVPVSKDASLIRESVCCSSPATTNFGSSPTVDAGQFHHSSRALFGFTLPLLDSNTIIQRAELVLGTPSIAGTSPATLILGYTTSGWGEATVTWNTRPTLNTIGGVNIAPDKASRLEVTASVKETQRSGLRDISFALDATGQSNVFFKSKESDVNNAAYLVITTESQPLPIVQLVSLVNRFSGRCADIAGGDMDNGGNLLQWDCHGGPNQKFWLAGTGRGTYALIAEHSRRCIDLSQGGVANGTNILQWDCHGGPNQEVRLLPTASGASKIQFVHSNKCMDVEGPSVNNGANIHQWECVNGASSQEWFVKP